MCFLNLHLYVVVFVINEICEMDGWWMLFSSMKINSYDFSSKKCDYGKVNPIRVDCDT